MELFHEGGRGMFELLDGKQVETVRVVAHTKSISRAAEQLGYVQSTITSHVKMVEKTVGQTLFHRLPRGVELTEAGAIFLRYSEKWSLLGRELTQELPSGQSIEGTVTLSVLESFCTTRMTDLLTAIFLKYPRIKLHLLPGFMEDTCQRILQGECELGIVAGRPQMGGVDFLPLVNVRMVWVVPMSMQLRWEEEGWEALDDVRVIGFGPQCVYQAVASQLLQESGIKPSQYSTFYSLEMMKQTIKVGMGMALLPYRTVKEEIEQEALGYLPLQVPTLIHGLVWKQGDELSPAAITIRDILVEKFKNEQEAD